MRILLVFACCALLAILYPDGSSAQEANSPEAKASVPVAVLFAVLDGDQARFEALISENATYIHWQAYDASSVKPLELKDLKPLLADCGVLDLGRPIQRTGESWLWLSRWQCEGERGVIFKIERGKVAAIEDSPMPPPIIRGERDPTAPEPRSFAETVKSER